MFPIASAENVIAESLLLVIKLTSEGAITKNLVALLRKRFFKNLLIIKRRFS